MSMKLYEFAPTRSIRARWTLQELGVDFEAVAIDLVAGENRKPEFLALNPAGKVPVLVDGDLVLTESATIVWYLAEKYADRGLLPADLAQRAQVHRWLLFAVTELEQPLWRIAKHVHLYPPDQRLPAEVNNAGQDFKAMAPVLDEHMRGRNYVVGDAATIADFVTAYTLDMANEANVLGDFPRLVAYLERMYDRPRAPMRIKQAFASISA
jgi:glutathione S-transferase